MMTVVVFLFKPERLWWNKKALATMPPSHEEHIGSVV